MSVVSSLGWLDSDKYPTIAMRVVPTSLCFLLTLWTTVCTGKTTLCRMMKTQVDAPPAPLSTFSACCTIDKDAADGCCQPKSAMWEAGAACFDSSNHPTLSLDAGVYGSYKLLAVGDPKKHVYATLDQVMKCTSSSQTTIYEELNATLTKEVNATFA